MSPDEGQLSLQVFMIAADKAMLSWVCWGIILHLSACNYFWICEDKHNLSVLEFGQRRQSIRRWRKSYWQMHYCGLMPHFICYLMAKQRCCDFRYLPGISLIPVIFFVSCSLQKTCIFSFLPIVLFIHLDDFLVWVAELEFWSAFSCM